MLRHLSTLLILVAIIGLVACGGHGQVPPTAPSSTQKQTLASTSSSACLPDANGVVYCIVQAGGNASCTSSIPSNLSDPGGIDVAVIGAHIFCTATSPNTLSFTMKTTIGGMYPSETCDASTWSDYSSEELSPDNFTAVVSPTTSGATTPCTNVGSQDRVDSSTLTIKFSAPTGTIAIQNGLAEEDYAIVTVKWNDHNSTGTGTAVQSAQFGVHVNVPYVPATPTPSPTFCPAAGVATTPRGKIAAMAGCWYGMSDVNFTPDKSTYECQSGCVYTVNHLVNMATGQWLCGSSNTSSTDEVKGCSNVTQIANQSAVAPGDLIIVDSKTDSNDAHIGVCLNQGCTQMNSNSSSHCTFTFNNPYFDYPGSVYHNGTRTFWRVQ